MNWLWISSSRSMRASSAPILWLKPTMSVNMIAARRRVSTCLVLAIFSGMAVIIVRLLPPCQTPARRRNLPAPPGHTGCSLNASAEPMDLDYDFRAWGRRKAREDEENGGCGRGGTPHRLLYGKNANSLT